LRNGERIDKFGKYMKVKYLSDGIVNKELGLSVGMIGKSRKKNEIYQTVL
jgi:hypothetical protein